MRLSSDTTVIMDEDSLSSGRSSPSHFLWSRPKQDATCRSRRPTFMSNRVLWLLSILLLAFAAVIIWLSLCVTVEKRLRYPTTSNGVERILKAWRAPSTTSKASPTWEEGFTEDVTPISCHAHNDYVHRVPLYEALAAGCASVEADIWLVNDTEGQPELFIGHTRKELVQARTLRSLYLDPLLDILEQQNRAANSSDHVSPDASNQTLPVGVFDESPNATLVLLLDFKTGGQATWETVLSQLADLRQKQWLTYWTPAEGRVIRPLTIVGSGLAPFDLITANQSYRDVFFDAPLNDLAARRYTTNDTYYASASLTSAVGRVMTKSLSQGKEDTIKGQVKQADDLGLLSRYWATPSWPVSWRNRIWDQLVSLGASVLNVDDLTMAAHWDWEMCIVGGIVICG